MSKEAVDGAFSGFRIFEAEVDSVDLSTGNINIISSLDDVGDPESVPPAYYGGISGTGVFKHPEPGDLAICTRVYPGGKGITQILRIVPKEDRSSETVGKTPSGSTNAGTLSYPIQGLTPGDVRIYGLEGNKLELEGGNKSGGGAFLGKSDGHGYYILSNGRGGNSASIISDSISFVSDATRVISREVQRVEPKNNDKNTQENRTTRLKANLVNNDTPRGIFPGPRGSNNATLGIRNPRIAEYRFVANEIVENDGFSGWDNEEGKRNLKYPNRPGGVAFDESISKNGSLHLSPHQLVEVVIGNVVNKRGESLDSNYNPVIIGDALGMPRGASEKEVNQLADKINKRGIGYHFQLSTNSNSNEYSNSYDNFIMSVDKEGALKVSIPKTSSSGNVLYPAKADFYNSETGRVDSSYHIEETRRQERIPITLRHIGTGTIYPSVTDQQFAEKTEDGLVRYTGIRHSNDKNYFRGFSGTSAEETEVRVNPTKYHNMYAAAEMLIANEITEINIPFDPSKCSGFLPGSPVGKPFEVPPGDINGGQEEVLYMSTVRVKPGAPAINPGGGVVVAGRGYDSGDIPYSNDIEFSGDTITNVGGDGESRLDPGGKSANINLEGSLEMSVGADNVDNKSILLDAAGSMIAWLGKDANDRSLVLQTDGSAAINIGGHNGSSFNKGKFDLRVNVTDKGYLEVEETGTPNSNSDYIISISDKGLVIAGMAGTPMVIRNNGNLSIESSSKLSLCATTVEIREGGRTPKGTDKGALSNDTPEAATPESVQAQIECLMKALSEIADG